jgi:hypothetical protein
MRGVSLSVFFFFLFGFLCVLFGMGHMFNVVLQSNGVINLHHFIFSWENSEKQTTLRKQHQPPARRRRRSSHTSSRQIVQIDGDAKLLEEFVLLKSGHLLLAPRRAGPSQRGKKRKRKRKAKKNTHQESKGSEKKVNGMSRGRNIHGEDVVGPSICGILGNRSLVNWKAKKRKKREKKGEIF